MIKVRLGDKESLLQNCGYTLQEESELYDRQLQDIIDNTAWYLDNYETLPIYVVRWKDWKSKTPTIPYKYTLKGKAL